MQWWWIFAVAGLSSLLTLTVVGIWLNYSVRPSLKRELEQFFTEQGEQASSRIAERVEIAVKRGVVEGVKSLSTRDVLQDTTRNLAKTSAEIVEERLGSFLKGRRSYNKDQ